MALKQQKFILSWFWKPEIQNQDVSRATILPRALKRLIPCLFLLLVAPGILWLTFFGITPISFCLHIIFSDWSCMSFSVSYSQSHWCVLVAQSCPTLCDPTDCRSPGSSDHEFSRQEDWKPLFSPGDCPNPEIKPRSPALQADSLLSKPPGKPSHWS